jgi:flagellar biosynthesis protein FlhF
MRPLPPRRPAERAGARAEPRAVPGRHAAPAEDVEQLQMSTLSFQDYVRERMLKRRRQELAQADPATEGATAGPATAPPVPAADPAAASPGTGYRKRPGGRDGAVESRGQRAGRAAAGGDAGRGRRGRAGPAGLASPIARDRGRGRDRKPMGRRPRAGAAGACRRPPGPHDRPGGRRDDAASCAMRGLIEQRFGMLAFMEKLQRQPAPGPAVAEAAGLRLLAGADPQAGRRACPPSGRRMAWAAGVLERNLHTGEQRARAGGPGGVYALIGSTGVGKTTSTAKLAAAFATRMARPTWA